MTREDMTIHRARSSDLDNFLETVPKLLAAHREVVDETALRTGLAVAGLLDLAVEADELPDSLTWLAAAVEKVAQTSPSIAYALACRFVAWRATRTLGAVEIPTDLTSGVATRGGEVVAPLLFDPGHVLVLDQEARRGALVEFDSASATATSRSGLRDARLARIARSSAGRELAPEAADQALRELRVLTAAAAAGTAAAAADASEAYALERHQFGTNIASFAGLRAILVEMRRQVDETRALIAGALDAPTDSALAAEALATGGRAAVNVSIDAIQVHGGYGYIEEYPVAGLLRDALSLRARAGGRRAAVAAVATGRLGDPTHGVRT